MSKIFDRLIELEEDDDQVEALLREEFGDDEVDDFFRAFSSLPVSKPESGSDIPNEETIK